MGGDRQQFFDEIARSPANASQGDLQPLGLGHGVLGQQGVNRHVAGDKRKPVG
jgi:hypothetical protein